MVHGLVEAVSKGDSGERGGEVVHRLMKEISKGDCGERGGEVINYSVEVFPKSKCKKSVGEVIHSCVGEEGQLEVSGGHSVIVVVVVILEGLYDEGGRKGGRERGREGRREVEKRLDDDVAWVEGCDCLSQWNTSCKRKTISKRSLVE